MKYVITGSLGNISKPLTEKLVAAGQDVTAITSKETNRAAIESMGATAAVGSVEDSVFITGSFAGADAAYLMIPPNWMVTDWFAYQRKVADNYIAAIVANNIKKVVVLSSIGAHLRKGTGPIDGLAYLEEQLEDLKDINVKFLRPSYFFNNLHSMAGLIKTMGIMGSNFGDTDEKLVLVHTDEIVNAAFEELHTLSFTGHTARYISSDERHPSEIAAVLGEAVGKPGTPWVTFSDEQSMQGMLAAGLSQTIAEGYTTMGAAIRKGLLQEDYWKNRPEPGKYKLEDFAKEFTAAYTKN